MREWIATVERDYQSFDIAIRLAQRLGNERIAVAVGVPLDGRLVMEERSVGEVVPPVLRLPREAVEALRDALNGHMPPSDDADLREALTIERARVDRILASRHEDSQ